MDTIRDAHYFLLSTQGNVYSLTKICQTNGVNKVLFASLRRKIYLLDYSDKEGCLKPSVREILFTYIPNGAEIISLDVYNRSTVCDDFFIGITIIKPNSDHSHETYLNIYSEQDLESNTVFNIESVAQNCLSIDLSFIPYQLYHTELVQQLDNNEIKRELVWLLSGSDVKIHVFREDKLNHSYSEIEVGKYFPELDSPPSIILWLDILHTVDYKRRVTAYGCECGMMVLAVSDPLNSTILSLHRNQFEGPISQVRLFYLNQHIDYPCLISELVDNTDLDNELDTYKDDQSSNSLHLVVTSTLQMSTVFMDVIEAGLTYRFNLEDSENYDASLCVCTADIDMDGQKEIILGTYAQELLMYKYIDDRWMLQMQRSLEHPIHSLEYVDVTGDGVNELIVLTLGGLHVMQHSHDVVYNKFIARLKQIINYSAEKRYQKEIDVLGATFDSCIDNKN